MDAVISDVYSLIGSRMVPGILEIAKDAQTSPGVNGLKVIQLTSPELNPKFYGFSPAPNPRLIATRKTGSAALSVSRPLERDRAVDETGHQIAVLGRLGSRPFTLEEMRRLYLTDEGRVWTVAD